MDAPPIESEEARIRRELELLFEWEEEQVDTFEMEDNSDVELPPVTNIRPEELYEYLDGEGLLHLPLITERSIQSGVHDSDEENPRFWGDWKTKQVSLVRDRSCLDRIKYTTAVSHLDTGPFSELCVSRIWMVDVVPPLVEFVALLEGNDGVYKAGVEVGYSGFRRRDSSTDPCDGVKTAFTDLQSDFRKLRQHLEMQAVELKQLRGTCEEMKGQMVTLKSLEAGIGNLGDQIKSQFLECSTQTKVLHTELKELKETSCEGGSVSTRSVPDFQAVFDGMEGRMRTYAEAANQAQVTLFQEQEHEKAACFSRRLNLEVILTGSELWQKADIIALTETWEYHDGEGLEIPGFSRLASVWKMKRFDKGRDFGGLAVWSHDGLGLDADGMYQIPGPVCVFNTEEVSRAIMALGSGKTIDLQGLRAELFK
ncbi:hypothetical protein R1sor_024138 [Riccia sorocarpa]|uniref:Uncharacterized protein n=1 Tax=Riccia sorocarpa TaxID=122646 RepID=A0ABD3GPP3_9MARC